MDQAHEVNPVSGKEQEKRGLLTTEEIAAYLSTSVKTVYKWSSQGRIPCIKFSKKCIRFDLDKVQGWLATMEQKGRRTKRVEPTD